MSEILVIPVYIHVCKYFFDLCGKGCAVTLLC